MVTKPAGKPGRKSGSGKKTTNKKEPTEDQLLLIGKKFTDDEAPYNRYYVAEVKWNEDFGHICCHCVLVTKKIEKMLSDGKTIDIPSSYEDDLVFATEYVDKQVKQEHDDANKADSKEDEDGATAGKKNKRKRGAK